MADRDNISGARAFDGEDQGKYTAPLAPISTTTVLPCKIMFLTSFSIGYGNRYRMQQLQQEDWIKQQLREKELYKQNYKEAHAAADAVAAHNCNLLQAAQEDHAAKRKAMQIACAEANRQLAKEKRDRDLKQA